MFDQVSADSTDTPTEAPTERVRSREKVTVDDLEDALTDGDQRVATRLSLVLGVGYGAMNSVEPDLRVHTECCSGVHITANAGYRLDRKTTLGLRVATAVTSGDYSVDLDKQRYPLSLVPLHIGGFLQLEGYNRLWAGASLGVHVDWITDARADAPSSMVTVWDAGIGINAWAGVDALVLPGHHRVAVYGSVDGTLATDSGYSGFVLGVAYRR